MEYNQPTPPTRVIDSPCLHGFLNFKLDLENSILEFMASIDKKKEYVYHQSSIIPDRKHIRVNMMSFDPRLGALFGASSEMPHPDLFSPHICFS
jgi:hypothetical protein